MATEPPKWGLYSIRNARSIANALWKPPSKGVVVSEQSEVVRTPLQITIQDDEQIEVGAAAQDAIRADQAE